MNDFSLGFAFGSVIVALITSPLLTYFGIIYLNLRRMEKQLSKPAEIKPDPNPEVIKTVEEAEKILKEHKQNVVQS